jgi:Gpi18-like mannosyltransferase
MTTELEVTPEPSADVDDLRPEPAWRRFVWWLETPRGLVAMFAVAFVLRLIIAPLLGFYGDLRLYRLWADRLNEVGLRHFYAPGYFADYPPGYLYVLTFLGRLERSPGYTLLKSPAILGDLALAWIAATFAMRLAPTALKERIPVRAVVAAAVLFNPAVLAVGAAWGQVDVVPAALVLGALLLVLTGRANWQRDLVAMLLFAVAIAMKPQSGFLFPVLGYALFRRYLYHRPREERWRNVGTLGVIGVLSLGLWAISGIPFGLSPTGLIDFYQRSSNTYPVTSAEAFNFWGLTGLWRGDTTGSSAGHVTYIAGIPAFTFGLGLFVIGTALLLWRAHRSIERGHDQARVLLVVAAATSLLAFTVLTRMHERYLFPAIACLAPLVLWRAFRWTYAAVSALFVINLWFPFAYFNLQWKVTALHTQPVFGWFFGSLGSTDTTQKKIWALLLVATCLILLFRGVFWIEQVDGLALAGEPEADGAAPDTVMADVRVAPVPVTDEPAPADESVDERPPWPPPLPTAPVQQVGRWTRWLPIGVVAAACTFCLVILRSETTPANNLNDSAFHLQMVRWANGQMAGGRIPLDGWFPDLSLGSSFFHHYQSLPYNLTAATGRLLGTSPQTTYLWLVYLLLALWPLSVYWGARLLGWGRWPAAAAALVSPLIVSLPGYGYEHGSYTWQGYGVFTQLWAMWLLPITWGLTWRAVSKGKGYAIAALVLALTIATHFMTGYLAVMCVGVFAIIVWRGVGWRIARAAIVIIGGLLTAAWVLVPLLADSRFATQSEFYTGTIFNDSYGAGKILGWLFSGSLFDEGRFPILTLLVGVGFVVCALRARSDERARALLGVWTLSLLLYFGRATWGSVIDVLPGSGDLQMHRFIIGVHLSGILMAGVGIVALARQLATLARRWWAPAFTWGVIAAAVLLVLAPAWIDRADYDRTGADYITGQRLADATDGHDLADLVGIAKDRGGGRIYAGLRANWGKEFRVGSVPVYAELANIDADAIGFTFRTVQSLSNDTEAAFDETNLANYQMFGVRYLLLPSDHPPPVEAKLIAQRGRFKLYEVSTSGYFQVVDRIGSIAADRTNLVSATAGFRNSQLAANDVYPAIAFDGDAAPPSTVASEPADSPGTVLKQSNRRADGSFTATIDATRDAVVLLKASYDPRWRVTVDGIAAKPVFMAPSLVGVDVSAGQHVVAFEYESYPHYPLLLFLGALTLLGLAAWPRRDNLMRRIRESRPLRREPASNDCA